MPLVDQILPLAARPTAGSAVVATVNLDGTVGITVAGAELTASCLETYTDRVVGDIVFVTAVPGGYVVHGRFTTS